MMGLFVVLEEWFREPDSQKDPHYWAATLGGHFVIGLVLFLIFMPFTGPLSAVCAGSVGYATIWEVPQRRYGAGAWDCILDWVGTTFGAVTAASLWCQSWPLAVAAAGSTAVVALVGVRKRGGADHA